MNFKDRTAVVTGGANGIGRATALKLAELGAKVFVGDVRPDDKNGSLFEPLGIVQRDCDVRQEASIQKLIEDAVKETGRIDVLVNNAGIGMVKQITEVTEDDWDRCLDT